MRTSRGTRTGILGRPSVSLLLSLWFLTAAAGGTRAGQQKELHELGKPLQYEVRVVLKLIQVSVVDRKGQPVGDLDRDDFAVYDNGRPVEIAAFERHAIRSVADPPGDGPEPARASDEGPPPGPAMNRKFFLFFDFAFNNPRGIAKAKEAALEFLDTKVAPEDETAVLTYSMVRGLRVQEYLTRDHKKARETVASIDRRAAAGRASEIEERFWREATEGSAPGRESAPGPGAPKTDFSWERQEAKNIAQVFIQRLTDLAKALRYVPGRKDFLYFSSGVPSSMIYGAQAGSAAGGRSRFDPGDNVLREANEALLREFAASDCAFYAFDTREAAKVASLFTYDEQTFASGYRDLFSGSGVFGDQTSVFKDEQFTGRDSLQRLSQTTGGKYFGSIATYDRSLDQLQALTGTYYVLGLSVTDTEDGAFHEVRVEVRRKGLEVRGASGYFNSKPFGEFNDLERRLHLFDLALNERAFSRIPERFPMTAWPVALSDRSGLVVVGRMPGGLAGKLAGGALEIFSLVLDEEDNIVDVQRVETPASGPGTYLFRSEVPAGPGTYRCRLIVRNTVTGAAAVSSAARTVIAGLGTALRVLPIALFAPRGEAVHRLVARPSRPAGLPLAQGLYPLDADDLLPVMETLTPGSELTVIVPCETSARSGDDLTVNAQVVDAVKGTRVPVPFVLKGRDRRGPVQVLRLGIPAGALGPGSYILYVYVQDPATGGTAHGRAELTVSAG